MGTWTHLILEAYCCFSFSHKKKTTFFDIDGGNKEVKDNPVYIPDKRPLWCRNKNKTGKNLCPEFRCLSNGKQCPFFAYTNASKKDYDTFFEARSKKNELEVKK